MGSETERLLAILHNGSDTAVLDNASEIAAELRRMAARIAELEAENPRAAALLRAVEGLEKGTARIHTYFHREGKAWRAYDPLTDRPDAHGATLADALIALAGEVTK